MNSCLLFLSSLISFLQANWQFIVTSIITSLIVFFTWRSAKYHKHQIKEMNPIIPTIKLLSDKSGLFEINIVNTKPFSIVVMQIKFKKLSWLSMFNPKQKADWVHPSYLLSKTAKQQTFIEKSENYTFAVPKFNKQSTYKVYVETSGGRCQAIYRPKDES